MVALLRAGKPLALLGLLGLVTSLVGQTIAPQGGEYSITRGLLGDQTNPQVSVDANGGYAVWQDNATDGDGLGISARVLNNALSPVVTRTFRVNSLGTGDQQNPVVQRFGNGGAIFVWQGGPTGQQDIYARVISPACTFPADDILINTFTTGQQCDPAVALLADGNVVVVWSSHDQDGSMQGVFAQRLSPTGAKLGDEFQVNQTTSYNQRSPAVVALDNGEWLVAWVSEQQRFENSVDVYARRFGPGGEPLSNEYLLSGGTAICANPRLSAVGGGGFVAVWSAREPEAWTNSWDVVAGVFNNRGARVADPIRLNTTVLGNQFGPSVTCLGERYLVVWTSDYQDGSWEGVYGRFLLANGTPAGGEFRVNTTTVSKQIHPTVTSDGAQRLLAVWSSFVGGSASFELMAQRYAADLSLPVPAAPVVVKLDSASLQVTWPEVDGYAGPITYKVYVDGAISPMLTTNNFVVLDNLQPASPHRFRLAYQLPNGQASPVSEASEGTTWGEDRKGRRRLSPDGVPDEWEVACWGADYRQWPSLEEDSDGDGAANIDEFLAGTDPADPRSVLRLGIAPTVVGLLVNWTSVPGYIYQVQFSTDLTTWSSAGTPRFAAGPSSSVVVAHQDVSVFYRIIRIR